MPDYLNKNGYTYSEEELIKFAEEENMKLKDYMKAKSFTEIKPDEISDPTSNTRTNTREASRDTTRTSGRAPRYIPYDTTAKKPYVSYNPNLINNQESTTIKDVDTSTLGLFFNVFQQTNPTASRALSALAAPIKGFVGILDDSINLFEMSAQLRTPGGAAKYLSRRILAAQKGVSVEEFDETDPYNIVDLTALENVLDRAIVKHKDKETGKVLDFTELAERGEYSKAAESFVMETAGALPSLIVSRLPGGYFLLGANSFASEFHKDLITRPDQTADKIFTNAITYGVSDAIGEYFGGRFLNKLAGPLAKGGVKKIPGRVRDAMVGGVGGVIKTVLKGGSFEAMQEAITSVIQTGSNDLIYGDEKTGAEYFRKALHAGMIGFALGGSSGGVSAGMDRSSKTKFYEYLAPKSYKKQQLDKKETRGFTCSII